MTSTRNDAQSVDTVCGYCGVGCGITLRIDAQTVTGSRGTADHPANHGRLCTKGATTADMLTAPGRQTHALVRTSRSADLSTSSLDDALDLVARRFSDLVEQHGPDAVAMYVSGQMTTEAQYLANKLAKGFLRTNQIESNSRLCMASAGTGYKQSLGADGPPGSYDDIDHADAFLVLGSNMADCHPILFLRILDRVRAGATLIVVDPRRTATAARADIHLAVRPGTDLALLNGLLRLIVDADATDAEFIAAHTEGWESMAPLLEASPPDRVAAVTGVDESLLRRAADALIDAGEWMSLWTMGLNQSTHGTWNTNAVCNLHLATGTICRTGSGPFSLTGQPNAMGGREMGYLGPGLPGQRSALDDRDRAEVERLWGLPPGTISTQPGRGTVELFRRMADGDVKAAWIICTNPVASMANRATVIAALQRAEFVVVQDAFVDTETAAYADVVLPASLWTESDGTMVNSERTITLARQAVSPPGDARPDWELIAEVARRMGFGEDFAHENAAAVFDELATFHNPRTGWDVRGVDHVRLRDGPVQWPASRGGPRRNPIRYLTATGPVFPTPSGRARFLARPHLPQAELPDDDYPFVLTTGRLAHQWHTMTKTRRVAKLVKLNPHSFVQIHPDDAQRLGAASGDQIEIRSRRGAVRVPAEVDDAVPIGVCFAPMHFNDAFGPDLAINAVTNDAVDSESLQPEFKACAVALSRVETPTGDDEETSVLDSPTAAAFGDLFIPDFTERERAFLAGLVRGLSHAPPADVLPAIPASAPLSPPVRAWADGVLAGLYSRTPVVSSGHAVASSGATTVPVAAPERSVLVVFASQTGTVEDYVDHCSARLQGAGFTVTVKDATTTSLSDIRGDVLFLTSTTGDGDAPDSALGMWDALADAVSLDGVRFSVLGFGDSSYADFCGFARKLDARLRTLAAVPLRSVGLCEPDYATTADAWLTGVIESLTGPPSAPNRTAPLAMRVIENRVLTAPDASPDRKHVRHVAFELPAAGTAYSAGDALGVWPRTHPSLVDEWLAKTGRDGDDTVRVDDEDMSLRAALSDRFDIVAASDVGTLDDLPRLRPRLYSISSSPSASPDRVEITVSIVEDHGPDGDLTYRGLCSGLLADLVPGDEIRAFIKPNKRFGLPSDPDAPAIMIGPGTGIAPFRSFLHERAATGAAGDNWLFFGDRHRDTCFHYRDELDALSADGVLTRLDLAFSRDQPDPVYVQDRMRENAAELWAWLRRGAHVYVCGDAARMARDVDDALAQIVAEQGRMSPQSAVAYVRALAADLRYVRDVY